MWGIPALSQRGKLVEGGNNCLFGPAGNTSGGAVRHICREFLHVMGNYLFCCFFVADEQTDLGGREENKAGMDRKSLVSGDVCDVLCFSVWWRDVIC